MRLDHFMTLGTDWIERIDEHGFARIPGFLTPTECHAIEALWNEPELFRSEVEMAHHGYGDGTYRYFANPLPEPIQHMRESLYPELATLANTWQERLGLTERFPAQLGEFLETCATHSQSKPTPLLLRYAKGGYNRLHQDRYGEISFPLQITVLLSSAGTDDGFSGGEFLLTEGRFRMQSKASVVSLEQGDAVVFPSQIRPVKSTRGFARAAVRHGISEVRDGVRMALGVIFHDAG
jgi:hypothetical protein